MSKKEKFIIKIEFEGNKKNINLLDIKNNWKLLYDKILESIPTLKDKNFVFYLPNQIEIPDLKYFNDEETYNKLYNYLENEYKKDSDKFSNKNAPIFTLKLTNKISDEYQNEFYNYINKYIDYITKNILNDNFNFDLKYGYCNYIEEELKNRKSDLIHNNIQCNNCYEINLIGKRFICSECNNYNLCENCEKLNCHNKEHSLIKLNKEINDNNYLNYQNIICNNERIYNFTLENFQQNYEIKIINIGKNNFKNCKFMPIKYGKNYLVGKTYLFNDINDIETTINITLNTFPEQKGIYYSKWRMFTKECIPFGQVLYLKFYIN